METPLQTQAPTERPILGIFAVLLGASLATILGRLLSVGAADLRGALHLDFDGASWISTSYNVGLMFIGPFSVYLGGLLGARRVLLACAVAFSVICFALPLVPHLPAMIVLLSLAGLTAGTFYPLTLSFVLRNLPQKYLLFGIAAYAIDIVVTTHVAHSYESWLIQNLSWRWIFWTESIATPCMAVLIYFGIPRQPLPVPKPGQPRPSWRGFLYFSAGAACLYAALDQGQRLDWWRSRSFIAMVLIGSAFMAAALLRHIMRPHPLINFAFLREGNSFLLAVTLFFFRFALLSTVVLVPTYLGSVAGYSPEQVGPVLLWVAIPQLIVGIVAIALLGRVDSRLILASGFGLVAAACIANARLSATWSGSTFRATQLVLSLGEALAFSGLVGTIILELVNSGALTRGIDVLTFSGFFQSIRLLGGEVGSTFIQYFLQKREQFHSNTLGLHVQAGSAETMHRSFGLTAAMLQESSTPTTAAGRAATLLALTVRRQAFTLAIADCFRLVAVASIVCMLVVACMTTLKLQYKQVTSAPPSAS
ncbi:MFS transporter, DHA2 family, multidrug resistance protein [Bryocella elongata]|uniref:MFS transporter, DHA2 family, multidrug resistance protein n=1 Tax=Bryocella elongata TaxID=863522 RepID=A0A1H5VT95_9BACT|nr:MFS transporter [Bryocella elongata]SEF90454.1 MFS transporter, DHA2 family, multidrug resistance protein [Bryocella elongata]